MKNTIRGYAVLGILFLLFSVFSFVVPIARTNAFWITYAFTAIAFAAQISIWKRTLGKADTLTSKFLGFPVLHIGIVYLMLQIITFGVFAAVPTLPTWAAIISCAVIMAVSAVCMIAGESGRDEVERVEEKVRKKVSYIKMLQVDVELLAEAETDSKLKAELQQLAEAIRFSDPMSNEALEGLERAIVQKVAELKTSADKSAAIQEITLLLAERNKKCKILK